MLQTPFYNPEISYENNFNDGPFGAFADNKKFNRKGKPKVNFLGAKVFLPFGIPAGPLVNEKYCRAAFQKGFDINVYKTVRTREYPCHKNPNILSVKVKGNLTIKKSQGELVADDNYSEPAQMLQDEDLHNKLEIWLEQLNEKQRTVVERRFGLNGKDRATLEHITNISLCHILHIAHNYFI